MNPLEIISINSLVLGLLGMAIIIFRHLSELDSISSNNQKEGLISNVKRKSRQILPIESFSYELFLEKFLKRLQILTLRLEGFIFSHLQKLREKRKEKTAGEDSYWKKIKEEVKK
ncbi:hypothetical protein J7J18_01400 [bacterium]|nr:hypothetical protein [bacterium]